MKRALVPGTFDPITEGHLDIIRRASLIFDEIIVSVAESATKGPLFSLEERVQLARDATEDIANVRVEPFTELLVEFAKRMDASVVVKGLRAITDFEYEFQMTALNFELSNEMETLFIMSPPKYMYLSSSVVREIARLGGNIQQFVTPGVMRALQQKYCIQNASE